MLAFIIGFVAVVVSWPYKLCKIESQNSFNLIFSWWLRIVNIKKSKKTLFPVIGTCERGKNYLLTFPNSTFEKSV